MAQFGFSIHTSVVHIHHFQSPGQIEENEHTISSTKEGNQQLRQQLAVYSKKGIKPIDN